MCGGDAACCEITLTTIIIIIIIIIILFLFLLRIPKIYLKGKEMNKRKH